MKTKTTFIAGIAFVILCASVLAWAQGDLFLGETLAPLARWEP
ncbi:MAG: hypothetical protein M2R45_03752 [Verrucomicrobia subdivision 3 bacterium]|nr:hypothetical protein [Limisphaerales bacterium]MCS1416924.1 hypothetical protein [Limisphaerales bacterium]